MRARSRERARQGGRAPSRTRMRGKEARSKRESREDTFKTVKEECDNQGRPPGGVTVTFASSEVQGIEENTFTVEEVCEETSVTSVKG